MMSKRAGAISKETRQLILDAARHEFFQHGFQGSSLRRICAAAGVTTGAVYFFFNGKDDLFKTVISEVTEPVITYMQNHYAAEQNFLSQTTEYNEQEDLEVPVFLIDFYFAHRETWAIFLNHRNHPAVKSVINFFVDISTDHYLEMFSKGESVYPRNTPVDRFSVRQFVQMQMDMMLYLQSLNFKRDEMLYHAETAVKMIRGAFDALLKG